MTQIRVSTSSEQSIYAALELSKNNWLLTVQVPGRDNPSLYPIGGGLGQCREERLCNEHNTPKAKKEREARKDREERILQMGREEYLNRKRPAGIKNYAFPSTSAGLVSLMGRHDGKGEVDRVDVLDTDPKHIDPYIATGRAYSTKAVPPLVNLLGDALTLGQMLNPNKSKVPVVAGADPKAKSTEFKNMIRCVVFKSARFDREVPVGLNRTDARPVIKVFPKLDLGLGPETDLYLRANDRAFFEDQVCRSRSGGFGTPRSRTRAAVSPATPTSS